MEKENAEARKINFCSGRKNNKHGIGRLVYFPVLLVFVTVYALILPAITMEKANLLRRGHTHTLACYSNPDADVETAEQWESTCRH